MIKSVKVKKINKYVYRVIIKGKNDKGKYDGETYIKECLHCDEPFFTKDADALICRKCEEKGKMLLKDFLNMLSGKYFGDNDDKKDNKKSDIKPDKKDSDTKIPKERKTDVPKAKIVVDKFDEKYDWLVRNQDIPVKKSTALKLMEMIARRYTIKDMANVLGIKEHSVERYISDLQRCGLVLRIRNKDTGVVKYEINPSIKYTLKD